MPWQKKKLCIFLSGTANTMDRLTQRRQQHANSFSHNEKKKNEKKKKRMNAILTAYYYIVKSKRRCIRFFMGAFDSLSVNA